MGLLDIIGFGSPQSSSSELPEIFPVSIAQDKFIKTDLVTTYSKILTDVAERTHGLSDDEQFLLWDNCLKSNSSDGLITLLSKAMCDKAELFLVYDRSIDVVRKATSEEEAKIREQYKDKAQSPIGVYVSFKNFERSEMLKLYSILEYCTVSGLYKQTNIAKAIQIKFSEMRSSVSAANKADFLADAIKIATALREGRDVAVDAKDLIDTAKVDLAPTEIAIRFIAEKKAYYLGMPTSYIKGQKESGGLSDSVDNDTKLTERGLKNYFQSCFKPVVEALFNSKVNYKSQDNRQIALGLEMLKVFSITEDDLVTEEQKKILLNQVFDFDTLGGTDADGPKSKPDDGTGAKPTADKPAPELPAKTNRT